MLRIELTQDSKVPPNIFRENIETRRKSRASRILTEAAVTVGLRLHVPSRLLCETPSVRLATLPRWWRKDGEFVSLAAHGNPVKK